MSIHLFPVMHLYALQRDVVTLSYLCPYDNRIFQFSGIMQQDSVI